jgi:uncharacterized damage-inducible protein DinB
MRMWPWFERHFTFDYPPEKFPDLLERVRGTPARVAERVAGLSRAVLTRAEGGWSIQEHIGHLSDLEPLHDERLTQLLGGEAVLAAADVTNRKTHAAHHNDRTLEELMGELRRVRAAFVARLDAVPDDAWGCAALHPRLQQPMRIVDLVYFVGEHDDYHLARIAMLMRSYYPQVPT